MNRGTLVCAGITFNVIGVILRDSKILLVASTPGPTPQFRNEPVTIFGEDGKGIGQGGLLNLDRPARRGDTVTITFELTLNAIVSPMAE